MQRREKILLIFFVSAIVIWRGLPILRAMVLGRLDEASLRIQALNKDEAVLEDKEFQLQINQRRMSDWTERSLPPEPAEAQRLYQEWLNDLAELAGISSLRVTPEPLQTAPTDISFRSVRVSVKGEATFEQLTYFLHEFYRADLLHRVQALKVESPGPGAPLKIVLMAEGLCVHGAQPRSHLFPRTELAESLPRSFDTLKVSSVEGFPKEPGFVLRIDNELATVTKIDGNKVHVKRAVEGTAKAYHANKAEVELFPVRFDQQQISLDDRKKTLAKHPFVQPAPPQAQVVDTNDPARQTKLMGTILTEGEPTAWLYNDVTHFNTVVKKGTTISIGDIQGTVEAVEANSIQIKRGQDLWRLKMGKDLRSMTRSESGGSDDSMLSGFSDDAPPEGRSGEPRNPSGRDRFRGRRVRRPEFNFESRPD